MTGNAFTLMFGFIFSNVGGGEEDSRLPVGIINEDESGAVTARLLDLIDASDVVRPVLLEEEDLEAQKRGLAVSPPSHQ